MDEKPQRFEKLDREGIGTSSMSRQPMYKYLDTETGTRTAIRRLLLKPELQDSFSQSAGLPSLNAAQEEEEEDYYGVPCMTIREVSLLKIMNHKNVARLVHVEPDNEERFLRLYLEYAGVDLTTFLKENPIWASDPKVTKDLLKQLLHGVAYYHSIDAAHGNLRPHNVLIDIDSSKENVQYNLLITNLQLLPDTLQSNYKAPELLLGSKELSPAADMFSVGCIFFEMLKKKPLFDTRHDQIDKLFRLMGTPNEDNWPGVTQLYGKKLSEYRQLKPKNLSKTLFLSDVEPAGVHLLSKMLCLNPSKRITAADALKHRYFADVDPKQPPKTTTAATASSSASTSASVNP